MSNKGHLAPSNLTFVLKIAIDRNGFRRTKEEGQIYKILPQIFKFLPQDLVMIFQSLMMILPRFFDFEFTMKFQCEENVRKMSGKSEEFSACVELM